MRYLVSIMIFICGMIIGCGSTFFLINVRQTITRSHFRTEATTLWAAYRMWVEAGRPSGTNLQGFAESLREWDWIVFEKDIWVGNQRYHTLFCDPDLQPYNSGVAYATTNGAVIWEPINEVLVHEELP